MIQFPDIDPVIFSVGALEVRWYGVAYVVGILIAIIYAKFISKKYTLSINNTQIEDFTTWSIIGIVIGGRVGFVIFYDPIRYLFNPIDILKIYQGGMSFHGGVIGITVAAYLFSKKYQVMFLSITDLIAITAPIGIFFGRLANFINGELYGRITNIPWAMIFPNTDMQPRHPSQLYEAFTEGFILFVIMTYFTFCHKCIKIPGKSSAICIILYSIFRIIIEFFREPDVQIGFVMHYFTIGQILSFLYLIGGVYLYKQKANKK